MNQYHITLVRCRDGSYDTELTSFDVRGPSDADMVRTFNDLAEVALTHEYEGAFSASQS